MNLPRLSLDIAPVAQEIKIRTEETIEKKKKGQKLKKEDLKKELDVVSWIFFFHFSIFPFKNQNVNLN